MKAPLAALLCIGVLLAGSDAMAEAPCKLVRVVEWPVHIVRNKIRVDGAINGQPVGIVLDTGAMKSMVLRATAQRLDLPRNDARGQRMYGWGGETKVEIAVVDDFRLGTVSTKGLQLFVAGEGDMGEGNDVLLGEDFLQRFDVEFDLAHDAVRLFRPEGCATASLAYWTKENVAEVAIEPMKDARPRIAFTVRVNDRPLDAFLDSGASSSYLAAYDAAAVGVTPETPGSAASYPLRGLGSKTVPMWVGKFASFAIGNESIPDIAIRFGDLYKDMSYATTGSSIAKKVSPTQPMIIGADFLRAHRVLVSHGQGRMYFTYVGGPVFLAPALPPSRDAPAPAETK